MRVVQFGAPTYDEKRHHFLWRFSGPVLVAESWSSASRDSRR
ncbi:MAG: hypothetical protein ACRDWY_13470 [Actinomycetes bacterium]